MSLSYTRYLENNQTFCLHVTFFWRYLIDKLRKNLLNCLLPFFQIFLALLKRCSRKKFVSNTSVHTIQLFQLAVLYFTPLIKWTNSVFKYSWTRQHKTTATLETNKVAAVKRFKQESIYGMSAEKVAVIRRSTVFSFIYILIFQYLVCIFSLTLPIKFSQPGIWMARLNIFIDNLPACLADIFRYFSMDFNTSNMSIFYLIF